MKFKYNGQWVDLPGGGSGLPDPTESDVVLKSNEDLEWEEYDINKKQDTIPTYTLAEYEAVKDNIPEGTLFNISDDGGKATGTSPNVVTTFIPSVSGNTYNINIPKTDNITEHPITVFVLITNYEGGSTSANFALYALLVRYDASSIRSNKIAGVGTDRGNITSVVINNNNTITITLSNTQPAFVSAFAYV